MKTKIFARTFIILIASWSFGYSLEDSQERNGMIQNPVLATHHCEPRKEDNRVFTIRKETAYGLGAGLFAGRNWLNILPTLTRYPLRSTFVTLPLLLGANHFMTIYDLDRQKLATSFLLGFGLTAPYALRKEINDAARRGALI